MVDKLISAFKKNGFVKLGQILSLDETKILKDTCENLLKDNPKVDFSFNQNINNDYIRPTLDHPDWSVIENIIGLSDDFDRVIENFFNNNKFKEILENIIGKEYKLWTCSVRLAKGNDNGLGFHNDSPGEIGITILLEDQDNEEGTTSVISGSHRWPITSQETKCESVPTKLLKPFSTAITGDMGDVFLFFKKTLHGRIAHSKNKSGLAIMMGLFPIGYTFTPYQVPQNILEKVGSETRRLMSHENLKLVNNNGLHIVTGKKEVKYIDKISKNNLSIFSPWNILRLYPLLFVYPVQKIKSFIKMTSS